MNKKQYLQEQDRVIKKTGLSVGYVRPRASVKQLMASGYRYLRFLLRNRLPSEVMIDITSSCNSNCVYCPRQSMPSDRKNKYMSMQVFNRVLSEMKRYDIRKARLYSTGEPLLHPDFDSMVGRLKQRGIHVTVSTNGALLMKHRAALLMVDHIQISVSGWDQTSFEQIHPPLRFNEVYHSVREFYQSIQMLADRPYVSINMLMTPETDMWQFRNNWLLFCDEITSSSLTGMTVFKDDMFQSVKCEYCFPSVVDYGLGCSYPFDTLTVSYDGKIGLCCQDYSHRLPLGFIQDGLKPVFNSGYLEGVRRGFFFGVPRVCLGCGRFRKVKQ